MLGGVLSRKVGGLGSKVQETQHGQHPFYNVPRGGFLGGFRLSPRGLPPFQRIRGGSRLSDSSDKTPSPMGRNESHAALARCCNTVANNRLLAPFVLELQPFAAPIEKCELRYGQEHVPTVLERRAKARQCAFLHARQTYACSIIVSGNSGGLIMSRKIPMAWAAGLAVVFSLFAFADEPKPQRQLMQKKLEHSREVLAGLSTEDFARVAENAQALERLTNQQWVAVESEPYRMHLKNFRFAASELHRFAGDKNLEGATLAYLQMTMSCIDCHKYLRRGAE